MNKRFLVIVLLLAAGTCVAQNKTRFSEIKTIELQSPTDFTGPTPVSVRERYLKACLNLLTLDHGCGLAPSINFGDRIGVNINLFHVSGGRESRTRMAPIGKHEWTDEFTVPLVEPWEPLGPGEQRTLSINASGADGAPGAKGIDGPPGAAGMNGDGTYTPAGRPPAVAPAVETSGKDYASAPAAEQVSSSIKGKDGTVRRDGYAPILEAKKGFIYAVRVVEGDKDYYVLVRVEDVVDGELVKLSYMKLQLPPAL